MRKGYFYLLGMILAVFSLTACSGNKAPTYYFAKDDDISSITKVVGKRAYIEPAETTVSANTASAETETASESEGDTESALPPRQVYSYANVEAAKADVEQYVTYLTGEKAFSDLTPEDADKNIHMELAGNSPSEQYVMKLTIDYTEDSYTITAETFPGSLKDMLKRIREEKESIAASEAASREAEEAAAQQDKPMVSTITWEDAIDMLKEMTPDQLGLEEISDNYYYAFAERRIVIDQQDYFDIRINERMENGSVHIKGLYLVASNGSAIYKYNAVDDTLILLTDPTT